MDRKVKHRVLGFFVVVALVIILLPLFQSGKDVKSQTTLIKAPPFPDQSVQVNTSTNNPSPDEGVESTEQQPASQPAPKPTTPAVAPKPDDTNHSDSQTTNKQPIVPAPQAAENTIQLQSDDVITNSVHPVNSENELISPDESSSQTSESAPSTDNQADIDGMHTRTSHVSATSSEESSTTTAKTISSLGDEPIEDATPAIKPAKKAKHPLASPKMKKAIHRVNTIAPTSNIKMRSASTIKSSFSNDDLLKLKNTVWVIQLGSFKNKSNALRLVNQLRASGYRAFIQQVNTTSGDSTRVFVGPELKQTAARALAGELETSLHVHGIVISYQPLAL